ncbi:hypothetical protein [Streptomyces carpaticus]|uniref:hypothetical protein n=1 Tax=Streptomyces carpaticus TaxID=285558 RepID=UPI0031F864A2
MTHTSLRAGVLGAVATAALTLGAAPALATGTDDIPRTLPIADPGIVQPADGMVTESAGAALGQPDGRDFGGLVSRAASAVAGQATPAGTRVTDAVFPRHAVANTLPAPY